MTSQPTARGTDRGLTLMRIAWTNLKRDRVAQAMTFLLPIIFFSIFATVFGNQGDCADGAASASRWSTKTSPS